MKQLFTLFISLLFTSAIAQNIVRGPYLQSPTHESIIIMWRTDASSSSKVWYGTDPANLSQTVEINNNVTDHIVQLPGLQPASHYYYQVGTISGQIPTNVMDHSFKTNPVPGTQAPVRVWAIGDFGRANAGQIDVKNSFETYTGARGADVWLWLGDNAYSDGSDNEYQSKVFDVNGFSDVFSDLPFWPSPGNHDYNTVWSESTLLGIPYANIPLSDHEGPYFDIVEVPQYAEAGGYPSQHEVFYSFDYGDVHFLSLNSEVFDYTLSYDGINQMKDWIEDDLQQNTRKFTIAYFHQPPYSKGSHDSDDVYELVMKAMREKVIPLLESYDVDLVVNGHSHVFERSFLIKGHYGNTGSFDANTMLMSSTNGNFDQGNAYIKDGTNATPEGTVYVVCGNSGSSESGPDLDHPAMVYSDGGSNAMGSFIIDIYKNRLDGKYLKVTGQIDDEFTILKQDLELQPISDITICEGDSVDVTILFDGGSDSITYYWQQLGYTNQLETLSPTSSTQYTVEVTDGVTGQVEQISFNVNVDQITQPVITESVPGTLGVSTPTNYTYQWFINGSLITGATNQFFTPSVNGNYTVQITAPNGCEATSDVYAFGTSSIFSEKMNSIDVFPNPADKQIQVNIPEEYVGDQYLIINSIGQVVLNGVFKKTNNTISVNSLESGVYIISTSHDSKSNRIKFTKK